MATEPRPSQRSGATVRVKAPKRKRDYKAEYARRTRNAPKGSPERQKARGHRPKEHIERAQRAKAKYGVSPGVLTRLRRLAKDKLFAIWKAAAKNPYNVSERTIKRGMKYLHAQDLIDLIDRDRFNIVGKAAFQSGEDAYYAMIAEDFPVSVDDLEAADDYNPYWYHR